MKKSEYLLKELPRNINSIFNGNGHNFLKNDIHPYFASFPPMIPRSIIDWFTKEHEFVLDPFCGSGTTLVESKTSRRNSIGIDVNPLACLISKVKTTLIDEKKLNKCSSYLIEIKHQLDKRYDRSFNVSYDIDDLKIPDFFNRDYWFTKKIQMELGMIKMYIDKIHDNDIRDFFLVALSSIIVKVSNQSHETQYCRIEKKINHYDAYKLLKLKIGEMIDYMKSFNKVTSNELCKIYCEDLRKHVSLEDNTVDVIVTSPPYLNAWDYNLYQRFRFFWLGFDPKKFRDEEIGAHLTHYEKNNALEKYSRDMYMCLEQMHRVLKKNKRCCIVIGDSILHGKTINMGDLLKKISLDTGFSFEKSYRQKILGPHFSQPGSINKKTETILILKKN